ncbi:nuclear receptor 2C2-associated protein-like [Apostichopus japonicus]|uniref:nuclear receptor 2C2-associated protein-like n=1 Tax=Stichopus japonicus TaxID=307972 RepID=UPI003AB8EA4F
MMAMSLLEQLSRVRVSSVLNNDVKQFGKKFLIDGNEETCWNSDQAQAGSGQWISLEFREPVLLEEIHLTFQGGFVGKTCQIHAVIGQEDATSYSKILDFFPKDDNSRQIFQIPNDGNKVTRVKIVFMESSDFYGRITVYSLDVTGKT